MAEFFNKTKGPLSFELHDGSVIVVPPKGRVTVLGAVASSAALLALVRQGVLRVVHEQPSTRISSQSVKESVITPPAPTATVANSVVAEAKPEPEPAPALARNWEKNRGKYESKTLRTMPLVAPSPVKEEAVTAVVDAPSEATTSTSLDSSETTVAAE